VNAGSSTCQTSHDFSRWFVPVNDKIAKGSCRAVLFLWAASALHNGGGIDVALPATIQAAVAQRFPFWAVVGIFLGLITVWFTACATDAQVNKFRQQDKIDPTFGEMSELIDAKCGIDFFHDSKEKTWTALNSYTHTGVLQIGRRFTEHKLEPSYKDGEIIEVIRACTMCIVLLVRPYLARQKHDASAKEIDKLLEKFPRK
jgi:uncharacterized protein DUF6988